MDRAAHSLSAGDATDYEEWESPTLPLDDFGTMCTDVYRNPISEQRVLKVRYRFGG